MGTSAAACAGSHFFSPSFRNRLVLRGRSALHRKRPSNAESVKRHNEKPYENGLSHSHRVFAAQIDLYSPLFRKGLAFVSMRLFLGMLGGWLQALGRRCFMRG